MCIRDRDYTPPTDFVGNDTFYYEVTDTAFGTTDTAMVVVTVQDVPGAVTDFDTTDVNTALNINAVANDTSVSAPDDVALTSAGSTAADPTGGATSEGGTVTLNDGGTPVDGTDDTFDYTPPTDFVGNDTFYYAVSDTAFGTTDTGMVVITVQDIPGAVTDFDTTLLNTCLLYTSPSPRDRTRSRMPSSA